MWFSGGCQTVCQLDHKHQHTHTQALWKKKSKAFFIIIAALRLYGVYIYTTLLLLGSHLRFKTSFLFYLIFFLSFLSPGAPLRSKARAISRVSGCLMQLLMRVGCLCIEERKRSEERKNCTRRGGKYPIQIWRIMSRVMYKLTRLEEYSIGAGDTLLRSFEN